MTARHRKVKRRSYTSTVRTEAARQTRQRIVDAARELFIARGYAGLTMQAIADRSKVALDTVYATAGRKPELIKLLVETAISNTDQPVPAEQRDYVQKIRTASTAREKLALYARAVVKIQSRLAPLVRALEAAAAARPELGAIWREISERRARNMKLFAADLVATGEVRADLSLDRVADILWATNGPELYTLLLEQRGWPSAELETWLADAWERLLLAISRRDPSAPA